jgi:hypothetical protein
MSITFGQFIELAEGKKKKEKIEGLKNAYLAGREQATRQAVNIPAGEPNSSERAAAIKKLLRHHSGGGAVRKAKEKREKEAEKAAKNILNREGFSYGSKSFQQELEKKRKEAEQRKKKEAEQRREQLRQERVHGDGMVSYEKDGSGVVRRGRRKDGKFTPDADT